MNILRNTPSNLAVIAFGLMLLEYPVCHAASPSIDSITVVPRLTIQSDPTTVDTIQYSADLNSTNWIVLTNFVVGPSPYWFVDVNAPSAPQRFYRVRANPLPAGMALIPAGSFPMGDSLDGETDARPHTVYVSAFYMDTKLVTYDLWQLIYQWATTNGYAFDNRGMGKAANHPVQTLNWYEAAKWCNARSEFEGLAPCYFTNAGQTNIYRKGSINLGNAFVNWSANGYRLPTEAEWEKAARGGSDSHRFPWSDTETINLSRANYSADPASFAYDLSVTAGSDPTFNDGTEPFTSPTGYFAPNGYGLYDATGNVANMCWDFYGAYATAAQTDPRGPASGSDRVTRGGTWCCGPARSSGQCRVAARDHSPASAFGYGLGFRCVRFLGP